nr:MAG TPA: hypothetical protein [Caudoviricetes sp.]
MIRRADKLIFITNKRADEPSFNFLLNTYHACKT